nr:CpsB/CapC family capsule biosynthesis tyrosine phosphatase [uncultured Sellimonas sp.]
MIDIHAHILPNMDNGARNWNDTLMMAQKGAECGTAVVVATSYGNQNGQEGRKRVQIYRKQIEKLRELLKKARVSIEVIEGMEILAENDIVKKLESGELLTLNKTSYVLLEAQREDSAWFVYRILDKLLEHEFIPVLAHPERYACVQQTPAHLQEWFDMGVVLQIDKGSVMGSFGKEARLKAEFMLQRGLALIAASNACGVIHRDMRLDRFYQYLEEEYGTKTAKALLEENPKRILKNQKVIRGIC